jgi:hypothetical protein
VYHFDHPKKDLDALTSHSEEMAAKCAALSGAPIPKRFEAKAAQLKAEFVVLCTATSDLRMACAGKDAKALDAAVEKVHTAYRACEQMFE